MNRSNELRKTLIFVVVAVALTGAAYLGRVDRTPGPGAFNDQGQKFFDDFDPTTCTTMEVVDYDPATLTALPFKVTNKAGKWVIPSHYDYPADARQRLVDTATGVVGLTKDSIRSDKVEDHETFGVLDPLDPKLNSIKGIGKRVRLLDASDKVLADFLIGKEVKDHPDQRYVRVPGQKRTYGVNVKVDLSTRFADWIETNLLKLDSTRARKVVIDHKTVNLETRSVVPGDVITLERKDGSSPWTLVGGIPEGKETNSETLSTLSNSLGDLKIAGIRPKPEGLTADLKEEPGEVKRLTESSLRSLYSRGFYPTRQGMFSTKGQMTVTTDEGVVYNLHFGEVIVASGDELSAGAEPTKDQARDKASAKDKEAAKKETSEGRFLFVTADFNESLLPPPKPSDDPDDKVPDDPFAEPGDDGRPLVAESQAAKDRAAKAQAERDRQVADGKKRAKELSERFAPWYYVTPGDSYRTLMVDRPNLVRDKSARPAGPPGGRPGLQGLPPGFSFPGMGPGQGADPHGP